MKLCRFQRGADVHIGVVDERGMIADLTEAGVTQLTPLLELDDAITHLKTLAAQKLPQFHVSYVRLRTPIEQHEVWAVGVTYRRSKAAQLGDTDSPDLVLLD